MLKPGLNDMDKIHKKAGACTRGEQQHTTSILIKLLYEFISSLKEKCSGEVFISGEEAEFSLRKVRGNLIVLGPTPRFYDVWINNNNNFKKSIVISSHFFTYTLVHFRVGLGFSKSYSDKMAVLGYNYDFKSLEKNS